MLIVIDVEATCTNTNQFPRDEMEIIEIGAVLCHQQSYHPLSSFQAFVRPVRHPLLTVFCTELTSIQQQDVDSASLFPEVMTCLSEWLRSHQAKQVTFCSWGAFDQKILRNNCKHHKVTYPFQTHINLKTEFARKQKSPTMGMASALRRIGLPLEGTHHRGIDDARNIAALLPFCL